MKTKPCTRCGKVEISTASKYCVACKIVVRRESRRKYVQSVCEATGPIHNGFKSAERTPPAMATVVDSTDYNAIIHERWLAMNGLKVTGEATLAATGRSLTGEEFEAARRGVTYILDIPHAEYIGNAWIY